MDKKTKKLLMEIAAIVLFLLIGAITKLWSAPADLNDGSSAGYEASSQASSAEYSQESGGIELAVGSAEDPVDSDIESVSDSSEALQEPEFTFEESSNEDEKPDSGSLNDPAGPTGQLDRYGTYTSKDDVALYINTYEELPQNFITKSEAQDLGWSGGSLEKYAPGKCIGGDKFGNNEKLLPTKKGRKYYECDIDTLGAKSRGAKRIVYSNDGLIYYTDDHYESFTLLYGEE